MNNFQISFLKRLTNQEFYVAYLMISSVMEGKETTAEYVSMSIESALAQNKKLLFLKNMNLRHPLTRTISELKFKRADYLLSLKGRVKSTLRSPIDTEQKAAQVLDLWLHGHREYLSTPRMHEQTALVDQMTDEVESVTEINEAARDAGVMEMIGLIELANADLKSAFLRRSREKTAARRKARKLKNDAYVELKSLINSMKLAISLGDVDSVEYTSYLNEMIEISDRFRAKYLSKDTRRKNAALENEANEEGNAQEGNAGEGESTGEENAPEGTQVATAMSKKPYSVMTLDVMDLHKSEMPTNRGLNGTPAMNGSVTNAVATKDGDDSVTTDVTTSKDGDATKVNKATTVNGAMKLLTSGGETANAKNTNSVDADSTKRLGASESDNDSNQES